MIEGGKGDGDEMGAAGEDGGENGEAAESGAGVRGHGFCALTFLRRGRGKVAARRAAAMRAGLGRLARSEAAFIEAPQWGHVSGPVVAVSGVCGVIGFVLLLAFGPGVNGQVFGGAENGLQLAEDHDDQAGRVFGEEVGEDLASNLFGFLVTHDVAAAAGAGDVPAPGRGGQAASVGFRTGLLVPRISHDQCQPVSLSAVTPGSGPPKPSRTGNGTVLDIHALAG